MMRDALTVASRTSSRFLAAVAASALVWSTHANAYVLSGPAWIQRPVPYLVNPVNLDLPVAAIDPAIRAGADVWSQQTNASFSFSYASDSTQTSTGYDGSNLVVFRNASSGSAIATTYWWSTGSALVDAGFYIEDIAAHEFGHALGLGHSTLSSATMYPSTAACDMRNRTLDADDIAGVTALYPPTSLPTPPTGVRIVPFFDWQH
jgi:hypothetical protein